MQKISRFLAPILAILAVVAVGRLHSISTEAQAHKLDLAEIDDIRYGLLDADLWVEHLLVVMDGQIESFGEAGEDREEVQEVFETVIHQLITEVEQTIRVQNEERSLGTLRQLATDFVIDFDELRDNSDEYAEIALARMERPENRDRLKTYVRERVDAFADSTYGSTDRSAFDAVLARHACDDRETCRAGIDAELSRLDGRLNGLALAAIAVVSVLVLVCAWPRRRLTGFEVGCLLVGLFALLFGGLFTPMIDIEAEIARLDLVVVGQPITFENQVLFFQSKSIIDVVELLVRTGRLDLVLVGLGIGLFSVVFPIGKLLATIGYHFREGLRERRPVRFFALHSGKWSMADVFVVALFLAYLGFDGLTGSQLAALLTDSPFVDVDTYNGTQLRAGFHLFAAFCFAGLAISGIVQRSVSSPVESEPVDSIVV